MKHLIITIDLPVDDKFTKLEEYQAAEAAKQAHKAARQSLPHFTGYSEENFSYKIES